MSERRPQIPFGWKLVPIRPTQDMLEAAIRTITNRKCYGTNGKTVGQMLTEEFVAMIHAAPSPDMTDFNDMQVRSLGATKEG